MKKLLIICCALCSSQLQAQLPDTSLDNRLFLSSTTLNAQTDLGGSIEFVSLQTSYPFAKICGTQAVEPLLQVLNIGADTIQTMQIELYKNGSLQGIFNYSEPIGPFLSRVISLSPIVIGGVTSLKAVIKSVNGMTLAIPLVKEKNYMISGTSVSAYLTLRIRTDNYAVENYWEILDQQGVVYAYGGNQLVGPGGGSTGAAMAGPGTYSNNSTILIPVDLPLNGCYQLHFVDSFGDGMCNDNGSFKLYETSTPSNILAQGDCAFGDKYELFGTGAVNVLEETSLGHSLKVYPNPAVNEVNVAINLLKSTHLTTALVNAMGQVVWRAGSTFFPEGDSQFKVPLAGLNSGVYVLQLYSDTRFYTTMVVIGMP